MHTVITLMQCTSRLYKNDSSGAAPDGLSDCPRPLFSPGSPSPLALARAAAGSALLCTLHYICNFNNGVRPPHHDARARIPPAPASRRARIPLRLLEARARLTRQRRDWSRRQGVGAAPRTSAADSAAVFSSLFRNSLMSCSRSVRPPARNGKGPTSCPWGSSGPCRSTEGVNGVRWEHMAKRCWPPPRSWFCTRWLRLPKAY